jgi:hypothetical protein
MDTHKQVDSAVLQRLRAAIDADDVAKLEHVFSPSSSASPWSLLGVAQTPYALVYNDDYDAGYIIEGDDGGAGYLVFDVAFLDGRTGGPAAEDGGGASSPRSGRAAGADSSSSSTRGAHNATPGNHGLCTCAHYAALRGAAQCLDWLLSRPGGRAVLSMAHHSGRSLEELAEDPRVLEVLLRADAAAAAAAAAGEGDGGGGGEKAMHAPGARALSNMAPVRAWSALMLPSE